jgi:starch-binding outer membrane protein, SusD/RagB family
MKRLLKITMVVAGLSLATISCELEKFPYDQIEQTQAFQTVKDAQTLNNGMYGNLRHCAHGLFMFSTDVQADLFNATMDFGNRNGFPHRWNGFMDTDYTIRDVWRGYYRSMANINNMIENHGRITVNTDAERAQLNRFVGEAHLMRAFYYHQLVIRWGKPYNPATAGTDLGVPLVLTFNPLEKPARATVKQVYDQILGDIAEAKTLMATANGVANSKRLTIDAALALEARVKLHMQDWAGAHAAAKTVIDKNIYSLVTTEADMLKMWRDDISTEVIFQLEVRAPSELAPTGAAQTEADPWNAVNNIYIGFAPASGNLPIRYSPDFVPQQWVVDLFATSDIRRNVFMIPRNVFIQGNMYNDIYVFSKYPGNPTLFTGANTNYQHKPKIFRVAELILIKAEAEFRQASLGNALETLNSLRTARGLAALTGISGAALFEEIKEERTRELLGEGQRLNDLIRWGQGFTRSTPQNMSIIYRGEDYELKTVQPNDPKFVWGIPANDITTNKNLVQNQGW